MSTYDDDYRALIEDARSALRALLDESEHDSWSTVRLAYGQLRDALARDNGERRKYEVHEQTQAERRAEVVAMTAAIREEDALWKQEPTDRREALVLDVLGEERLTVAEIAERLNEALTAKLGREPRHGFVYDSGIRPTLARMLNGGQLERAGESFRGKTRYRYFRKAGLDGPIADLDRAYHDDREEA